MGKRSPSRLLEATTGPIGEDPEGLVDRAELHTIGERLLEVVTNDLVVGRAVCDQPVGESFMQVSAGVLWYPCVSGVADEDVPKTEGILSWKGRALSMDEAFTHQPLEQG